jgi:hypothetical protein
MQSNQAGAINDPERAVKGEPAQKIEFAIKCVGTEANACPCPCDYAVDKNCACR